MTASYVETVLLDGAASFKSVQDIGLRVLAKTSLEERNNLTPFRSTDPEIHPLLTDKGFRDGLVRLNYSSARRLPGAAIFLLGALCAHAQSPSDASSLADQSLNQLLNTPVVTVSKREQPLSKAPAAVFVITREDIHRSGATTIPELLRLAPGVQVDRITATQWAVSIRGFNGLWSNKLLVLIDGRTIYSEIFSGVDWEMQDVIFEDIDRIEVVRGPGSSIWGANAMNGVINIVTRQAADTTGATLKASTGNLDRARALVQYGGAIGGTSFRVYGKFRDESLPLFDGEKYPDTHRQGSAGFRIDRSLTLRDSLTVQGDGYIGATTDYELRPVSLPNYLPGIFNVDGHPASFDVQAKWTRSFSDTAEISLQAFGGNNQRIEDGIDARDSTFDVELQNGFALGTRNSVLWGLESRTIRDRILGTPVFDFNPVSRSQVLTSGFFTDDITVVPDRLVLSVGVKVEKYSFTGVQPEPSAHLAWTPSKNQTVWASVGRAVRIPSRFELDIRLDAAVAPGPLPDIFRVIGNPHAASETLLAYEAGHRIKLGNRVSLDTAAYYNHYGTLRSTQTLAPELMLQPMPYVLVPLQYNQLAQGRAMGLETAINWDLTSKWHLTSNYSYGTLDVSPKAGNNSNVNIYQSASGSMPRHQAQIHSYWDISPKLQLDAGGRFVDHLQAQLLPAYLIADVRLGWRPAKNFEFNLSVDNLFNDVHAEWVTPDDVLYRGKVFGRTGNLAVVWHF